jgi:tetratricopeptide (TPR) repeat protein
LGAAYLLSGCREEAHTFAEQALMHARAHQERGTEAYALRLLGDIAAHLTPLDMDTAAAHYHQALVLAEEIGMRPLVAHCHYGLGRLYGQSGHGKQARAALTVAIDLYHTMDMTFWLPQTEAALIQVT